MRDLLHDLSVDVTSDNKYVSMSQEEWYMLNDSDRNELRSVTVSRLEGCFDVVASAIQSIRVKLSSWNTRYCE